MQIPRKNDPEEMNMWNEYQFDPNELIADENQNQFMQWL